MGISLETPKTTRRKTALKQAIEERTGESVELAAESGRIPAKLVPQNHYSVPERVERKRKKILETIERAFRKSLKDADFEYPDIIKASRNLYVGFAQISDWLNNDEEFKEKLAQIEQVALQDCRRIVYNAKNKNPFLAMNLLNSRASEFRKEIKHSGEVAHYHIISNVRTAPVKAEFVEVKEVEASVETVEAGATND